MKLRFVFKSILVLLFITAFSFVIVGFSSADSNPVIVKEEDKEEVKEEVSTTCSSGKLYHEKDGIVRVDVENPSSTPNGWVTENTLSGFEGTGYLVWTGNDNFSTPGIGIIKFSVKITNPGTYQFVWSSRITQGTSTSEHNDSWLRIATATDFYGEKASTGERVYPKGTEKTPNPVGTSANGWLKAYMNKVGEWFWRTNTNDKDPFNVFAKFDTAGVYDIEISGRSKGHAIDQFVLYKTDKTLTAAQTAVWSEITCK